MPLVIILYERPIREAHDISLTGLSYSTCLDPQQGARQLVKKFRLV